MDQKLNLLVISLIFVALAVTAVSVNSEPQTETTCNSCSDCSAKLNGDYDKVTLTNDLINQNDCIIFSSSNVEFDCDNHLIDGDSTTNNIFGVFMYNKNGNMVNNCRIEDYIQPDSAAIYLWNSNNNFIQSNTLRYNIKSLLIETSLGNIVTENDISNNENGIHFAGACSGNEFYNNNIILNNQNVVDDNSNIFNSGYYSGGNYWGSCTDLVNNEYPEIQTPDGKCDSAYVIDGDSQDNYPYPVADGWDINFAPVITELEYASIVREMGTVSIYVDAIDPNGDEINYNINDDDRFDTILGDSATFEWETGPQDSGVYPFAVTVDDTTDYTQSDPIIITVENTCKKFNKKYFLWDCQMVYDSPQSKLLNQEAIY